MNDQQLKTIETCSRQIQQDENGDTTVYYIGYDETGNVVGDMTGADFRRWLKMGFVEFLSGGEES